MSGRAGKHNPTCMLRTPRSCSLVRTPVTTLGHAELSRASRSTINILRVLAQKNIFWAIAQKNISQLLAMVTKNKNKQHNLNSGNLIE